MSVFNGLSSCSLESGLKERGGESRGQWDLDRPGEVWVAVERVRDRSGHILGGWAPRLRGWGVRVTE